MISYMYKVMTYDITIFYKCITITMQRCIGTVYVIDTQMQFHRFLVGFNNHFRRKRHSNSNLKFVKRQLTSF